MIRKSVNRFRLSITIATDVLLILGTTALLLPYISDFTHQSEIIPTIILIWLTLFVIRLQSVFFKNFSLWEHLKQRFSHVFACIGTLAVLVLLFPGFSITSDHFLLLSISLLLIILPSLLIQQLLSEHLKSSGKPPHILIAGGAKLTPAIHDYFRNEPHEGHIIGYLNDKVIELADSPRLGNFGDIEKVYNSIPFEKLLITADSSNRKILEKLIHFAERNGIRTSVILNLPELSKRNFELSELGGLPLLRIREVPLSDYIPLFWKRVFDMMSAITALIVLSPVLLIISIVIKLDSPGPVFYRAERIGREGKTFRIFKFRSMKTSTDAKSENRSTQKNDERITISGKLLRRYSLDELPQLLNVIEGTMSIVGPRPHRVNLDQKFRDLIPAYPVRRFIKPGITGWAQVNGWRGLTEKEIDFKGRALHDLWYLEHWSFGLDLAIIWLTVFGRRTHRNVF